MLKIKNCQKNKKQLYVLLETCIDDLETNDTVYVFDNEEDLIEKFEELKHDDIAFLIEEEREDEIIENTEDYYLSKNGDGTSSYELCTRVQNN